MRLIHSQPGLPGTQVQKDKTALSVANTHGQHLRLASHSVRPTIGVMGMSPTGVVISACLSRLGFQIVCVDSAEQKVASLNAGEAPVNEAGLTELIFAGKERDKLTATSDFVEAASRSNVSILSFESSDTVADLERGCHAVSAGIKSNSDYHLVIVTSSIPVGTTADLLVPLLEKLSDKTVGRDFGVCYMPLFLRNGVAVEDFLHPAITVIGAFDQRSFDFAERIFEDVSGEVIPTSLETAEMLKSVMGCWQAMKAGFGNEVGRLCKALDLDSHDVMNILIKDSSQSISPTNLKPRFSFGGAQSAKDIHMLKDLAKNNGVQVPLLLGLEKTHAAHRQHLLGLIEKQPTKKVGFVGITPNESTGDYLDSPTLQLIKELVYRGFQVSFYDPLIGNNVRLAPDLKDNSLLHSCRCHSEDELLLTSECLVVTHYGEYLDQVLSRAGSHIGFIDAVRVLGDTATRASYEGIGW